MNAYQLADLKRHLRSRGHKLTKFVRIADRRGGVWHATCRTCDEDISAWMTGPNDMMIFSLYGTKCPNAKDQQEPLLPFAAASGSSTEQTAGSM
jgi:hypothetical protein